MTTTRIAFLSALATVLSLFGGLFAGALIGNLVFDALPGHSVLNPDPVHIALAALPALVGFLAGGALWGALMGRMARATDRRRMALAGMLGFAPITITLGIALSIIEPIAVERLGAQFPIHRLFTLFFLPTAFLIAGVSAWALGIGLRDWALAWTLLLRVGLAAALAFLVMNVAMETAGWVVGAPHAVERFTMLTVMFVGNLGAALVGGAVLGVWLTRHARRA